MTAMMFDTTRRTAGLALPQTMAAPYRNRADSLDGFELYRGGAAGRTSSGEPAITVQVDGGLSLNIAASESLFGDSIPDELQVSYAFNRNSWTIAVIVGGAPGQQVYTSRRSGNRGGYSFSAVAFLNRHGLKHNEARRFPAWVITARDGTRALCADLSGEYTEPGRTAPSKR